MLRIKNLDKNAMVIIKFYQNIDILEIMNAEQVKMQMKGNGLNNALLKSKINGWCLKKIVSLLNTEMMSINHYLDFLSIPIWGEIP